MQTTKLQSAVTRSLLRRDRVIAIRAGWGASKTSALVFAAIVNARQYPNKSSLLICDTADRYRSVHHPEIEKWTGAEYSSRWRYEATDKKWVAPNGHTLWIRSYFRPSTRSSSHNPLEGLNITSGLVIIDEAQCIPREAATKAVGRIRTGDPCMIIAGLPVAPCWWVDMAVDAKCSPLFFTSMANPNLSESWFDVAKSTLTPGEYESMILNKPQPPTGSVYPEFDESNIVDNWVYDPSMSCRVAIDFGMRQPCAVLIAHDNQLGCDVIFQEISPRDVTLSEFIRTILAIAWPRASRSTAPDDRIWLDEGVGDKAGHARSDRTLTTSIQEMRKNPPNGLGLQIRTTTDPVRTDIGNGVQRLKRALASNKYRVTRELYNSGTGQRASLRRALENYRWDSKGDRPIKDGSEHVLDAIRYDAIIYHWGADTPRIKHRNRKGRISADRF